MGTTAVGGPIESQGVAWTVWCSYGLEDREVPLSCAQLCPVMAIRGIWAKVVRSFDGMGYWVSWEITARFRWRAGPLIGWGTPEDKEVDRWGRARIARA